MKHIIKILSEAFPIKAAVLAVIMGTASFLVLFLGFQFNLPGTSASTDPREVLNAVGAAFTGPLGALVIAVISSFGEPSAHHKFYIAFQHIISALWIGWAYKKLLYEKYQKIAAVTAWIAVMFVYYFITYIPGSAFLSWYRPDLWKNFSGGNESYIKELIYLYKGWIPEFLFTTGFTSLLLIALPDNYRKPLWGKESKRKFINQKIERKISGKFLSGTFLGIRLTLWFVLLSSIPLVLISIYIKNAFSEYNLNQSARIQLEYISQICADTDSLNVTEMQQFLKSLRKDRGHDIHFLFRPDNRSVDSLLRRNSFIYNENQISGIFRNKEGMLIFESSGHAAAYSFHSSLDLLILSFAEKGDLDAGLSRVMLRINQNLIFIFISISVLSGIIVWLLISVPVRKITRAINEMDNIKNDIPIDTEKMTDEIRVLANAFNEMKIRIKSAYEQLEVEMNQKISLQQKIIEANNNIKENEVKFRLLFESSNDGIMLLKDGKYIDCNKKAEEMFMLSKQEIAGSEPSDFSPEFLPNGWLSSEFAAQKIKAALSGSPQSFEWTHIKSDGSRFHVQISLNRLELNGELLLQAVLRDITEQKKLAKKLNLNLTELESKNAELERFTYTVSHDLKSPLITIKGFIGLLKSDIEKERWDSTAADLDRISRAADKMQMLLEDLLELSRIGRIINPSSRFSMTDVAGEALEMTAGPEILASSDIFVQPGMPDIFADRLRIREVYQNLIENAIKYREKERRLEVAIGCLETENGPVFFVQDNGIGIQKSYYEKIFGLFEKLDARSIGSGIGLAIVKRIIELHCGKIWVESETGSGSVFYFTVKSMENL